MPLEKMNAIERRAVGSLATIMSLRMLGLFMILPVFALYAHDLPEATPFLIGIAMGVYGLTQAIFQIPFGMLSDRFGRKPLITIGLLIFAAGSLLCALSDNIYLLILGRGLQGAGAVGSTIIAMIADLTRVTQRSKAMAINGITIGFSFSLAMILGPVLAAWIHINGIFWLAILFSLIAIALLFTLVPTPEKTTWHSDTEPAPAQFLNLLKHPDLARLDIGVLILHAIFTASFVVIPISLQKYAGLSASQQWTLYVPALLGAFVISLGLIGLAERKHQVKSYFLFGIGLLVAAPIVLMTQIGNLPFTIVGLILFFTGFSLLEAFLPSLVSRTAPPKQRGSALGIYSCSQFLGIFVGGTVGGWLYGAFGLLHVYLFCVVFAIVWLAISFKMNNPSQHSAIQSPEQT